MKTLLANKWKLGALAALLLSLGITSSSALAADRSYGRSSYTAGRSHDRSSYTADRHRDYDRGSYGDYRHRDYDRGSSGDYRHREYAPVRVYRSPVYYRPTYYRASDCDYTPSYRAYQPYVYVPTRPVVVERPCHRPSLLSLFFRF